VAAGSQRDLLAMTASVTELAGGARGGFVICLEPANGLPHRVAGAFVSERRWNGSANDAVLAVRRAAHEGPDILVVVPDDASVAQEVVAAAGAPGRLVVLGIVAPTALGALEAIVSSADRDREPQVRRALASSLRAAFSYRGLRRLGGGRTTVQDVVIGTTDVRARLDRGDFSGIEQVQRQGTEGMRTLDAALARAVARRQVALRQAASYAANRSELITLTRHDVRERRRLAREQRPGERRPGVLRAITVG
jgi:Tfp pilus assembly pilus retraction ATPase PilT